MSELVDRIEQAIKEKGSNFKRVERECGLGNGTIKRWGEQSPRLDKLVLVSEYLQISLDYLVFGRSCSDTAQENDRNAAFEHLKQEQGLTCDGSPLEDEEAEYVKTIGLLSYKPIIYVANVSDDGVADAEAGKNPYVETVREIAAAEGAEVVVICAEIEAEMAELEEDERAMFLAELGIEESGLDKLVKASYALLNLISFLTAGEDECRAWTIRRGTKAPQAAGKIHTDFEKGFIRAETIAYDKLMEVGGSLAAAKEKGFLRSEGKEYVMKDGDVVNFLFNV